MSTKGEKGCLPEEKNVVFKRKKRLFTREGKVCLLEEEKIVY